MAKIRTIKPEMKSSETVAKLSIHARLLFIWLITEADDEGRLLDNAKTISGTCFPLDEDIETKDVSGWLAEIAEVGLIRRYRKDGKNIIQLVSWLEHQRISPTHRSKSIYPPEFEDIASVAENNVEITQIEDDEEDAGKSPEELPQVTNDLNEVEVVDRKDAGKSPDSCRKVSGGSPALNMEHGTWNMEHILESPRVAEALPEKVPKLRIDEIFDAVCEVTLRDPGQMTKTARGAVNRCVSELKSVGASPGEIRQRAAVYRQKFPNVELSPPALTKHWDSLVSPAPRHFSVQKPTSVDLSVRVQIDPDELDQSKWPTLAEIQGAAG